MPARRYTIICLPTYGAPYIWSDLVTQSALLGELQRCVQGDIETFDMKSIRIHPLFEDNRWRIAQRLIGKRGVKMYVNDTGRLHCVPNMGVIHVRQPFAVNEMVFGEVALVLTPNALSRLVPDYENLLRKEDDSEDESEDENQ